MTLTPRLRHEVNSAYAELTIFTKKVSGKVEFNSAYAELKFNSAYKIKLHIQKYAELAELKICRISKKYAELATFSTSIKNLILHMQN